MYKHYIKRFLDFLISLVAIIILSPLLLVIIVALFLANKGSVFFLQERPGLNNKLFKIIKFKSMTDEKDEKGDLLPAEQRVTKIGKFIRNTSLDELPQLFNVLIGDMSLIGPRPLMPRYLKIYTSEQMKRHLVRPGISGWAQVNGRNAISWTKKFEYDVWYVDHISLLLDMKIIYLTIINVVKKKDINQGDGLVGSPEGFRGNN